MRATTKLRHAASCCGYRWHQVLFFWTVLCRMFKTVPEEAFPHGICTSVVSEISHSGLVFSNSSVSSKQERPGMPSFNAECEIWKY
jgi:hypothetical protein